MCDSYDFFKITEVGVVEANWCVVIGFAVTPSNPIGSLLLFCFSFELFEADCFSWGVVTQCGESGSGSICLLCTFCVKPSRWVLFAILPSEGVHLRNFRTFK